jgi:hypothetical protein
VKIDSQRGHTLDRTVNLRFPPIGLTDSLSFSPLHHLKYLGSAPLLLQILLEPGKKLLEKGGIDHLLHLLHLRSIVAKRQKHGILIRPLEVFKRRISPRRRVDGRLAAHRVMYDVIEIDLSGVG